MLMFQKPELQDSWETELRGQMRKPGELWELTWRGREHLQKFGVLVSHSVCQEGELS